MILTNQGNLYTEKADSFAQIAHNYLEAFQVPDHIRIGNNGEFWISSGFSGIFKISIEPFTKVQLNEVFASPAIGFPFVIDDNISLGLMTGGTYVGKLSQQKTFDYHPINIKASCEIKGTHFIATNKGIKKYVSGAENPFQDFLEEGKPITLIHEDGFDIWYSVKGKGLSRYNIVTQKKTVFGASETIPSFIYSAQSSFSGKFIYFGSNNGVFKYNKEHKKFSAVPVTKMGSYCGVSANDAFGNSWFSIDQGLIGMVNDKAVKVNLSRLSLIHI